MQVSKEMLQIREELLERFSQKRNLIDSSLTDEQLINNENYRECYLINSLLITLFDDEVSYEAGEIFLKEHNYNIDSLFNNYILEYDSIAKNFIIKVKDNE